MDIFALSPVVAATVAPGTVLCAARTEHPGGLADHRTTVYPQSARSAPGRAVAHHIDIDRIPRYVMTRRDEKAA
ncbi:hypothetical protein SSBR45G_65970 [Bradyrhizobium sp. SSBR45G]|uniref:hypothetical protein n=1 Tax=unclassified Bradyrhizobium TaxID=2631580 RepID=UPI002342975C|nr:MULTISPECIES: hypothetical protein [unclassified Bradyrhizobium]GLH81688.1 hypothetical protein SSBR45G_65970 [Bradyrhizobium sp. SSBR45G]GLH89110.1 hypothetical protein SSBR45R_65710 [Bradyrhizobium sp. SSBR45R]